MQLELILIMLEGRGQLVGSVNATAIHHHDYFFIYGAKDVHPVYNETLESNQFGAGLTVIVPLKMYKSSRLSLFANTEYIVAERNIDFYDSRLFGVFVGAIWNHIRP